MTLFSENNSNKKMKIYFGLLMILTLVRIFLFVSIPLDAMGNTPHDDLLLLTHADSISQGEWLGEYDHMTLVKGVSFPLFVAICKWLCIPYSLGLAFLYILSILVFLRAIKSFLRSPYLLGMGYLFLLYSPAMLSKITQQRPYNIALIPSAVLLTTGCFIGLFLHREASWKKQILWSLGAGISLSFFWYVREDSVWLAPFALIAVLISLFCTLKGKNSLKKKLVSLGITVLPFLLLETATLIICQTNASNYHTFTVNERTKSSFSDVMSDLVQMDMPQVRTDVWISHAALEKAMEFSPAFASIKDSVDEIYESAWASNGEIPGDIIAWALRDAAAAEGYYEDGATAEAFFRQVHTELQKAYKSGLCGKKPGIFLSSLSDGFVFSEDFQPLILRSLDTWKKLLFIEGTEVDIFVGTGSIKNLRFFEAMTLSPVVYPNNEAFIDDPVGPAVQRPVVYAQRFLKLFRLAAYPLVILSVIFYLWMTGIIIAELHKKQYHTWFFWLIITGLGGCGAIQIVEVCWFTAYLGEADAIVYSYCTGTLMLIQLVQFLSIGWGVKRLAQRVFPPAKKDLFVS